MKKYFYFSKLPCIFSLLLTAFSSYASTEADVANLPSTDTLNAVRQSTGVTLNASLLTSNTHPPSGVALDSQLFSSISGGRAAIGYRLSNLYGIELGYDAYVNTADASNGIWGPDHYYLNGADLVLTKLFPLASHVGLIAKLGGIYLHQNIYNQVLVTDPAPLINQKNNGVLPGGSLGLGLYFSHFSMGIGYTHWQKVGAIPSIDSATVDLGWRFG